MSRESAIQIEVRQLDPKVGVDLKKLKSVTSQITQHSGFLASTLDNRAQSKLTDSFAGHIVHSQIRASAQLSIIYICQFWDNHLPLKLAEKMQGYVAQIEQIRRKAHPDWSDRLLQVGTLAAELELTTSNAQAFLNSEDYKNIRVFRTENLAHNESGPSRDRKKLLGEDVEPETKYIQLVKASQNSFDVFDRLVSHWDFHMENSEDSFNISKSYSNMYWDALPIFQEIENVELLDTLEN